MAVTLSLKPSPLSLVQVQSCHLSDLAPGPARVRAALTDGEAQDVLGRRQGEAEPPGVMVDDLQGGPSCYAAPRAGRPTTSKLLVPSVTEKRC